MKLRAIDHVTLYVPSLDGVCAYYEAVCGVHGTEVVDGDGRGLRLENESLHFFMREEPAVPIEFVRRQHLSFEVESLEDVIAELLERGQEIETGRFDAFATRNFRWCEWRDPTGIRLECVEIAPAATTAGRVDTE